MDNIYFHKIIDPWSEYGSDTAVQDSKEATMHNYHKARFFLKFPRISLARKSDIVVIGTNVYKKLNDDLKRKSHVVVLANDLLKDFYVMRKLFRNFTLDLGMYGQIYDQVANKDFTKKFEYIRRTLIKINPKIIILKSTIDPINRVWAYWANKLNIIIVCLQHGVFSSKANSRLMERDIVDFYVTLGDEQSKIISDVIPQSKHINLLEKKSYICNVDYNSVVSICFIGTDHERYSKKGKENKKNILSIYLNVIKNLNADDRVEYRFHYKMHPSETKGEKLNGLVKIIHKSDFDDIDIFFGVASTLLVDLASLSRCAIQLRSDSLPLDNYEEMGYCGSISVDEIKNLGLPHVLADGQTLPCMKERDFSNIIKSFIY